MSRGCFWYRQLSLLLYRYPREQGVCCGVRKDVQQAAHKVGALYGYALAQLIAKAYQNAGRVDKEKFINAMKGFVVDSPVGKLEMRSCDHQLTLPTFFGVTKASPQYEYLVAGDLITISGKNYMPTCEEVLKSRK